MDFALQRVAGPADTSEVSARAPRTVLLTIALLLALGAPLLVAAPASAGPADDEARFVALVNQARAGSGLAPLTLHGELVGLGRHWAAAQAQAGAISHNPALGSSVQAPWTLLGENVGRGGSVESIFDALMASPSHRANILQARFTHIGVGVVHAADGTIYTSHQFMELPSAPELAPAANPEPVPATAAPEPEREPAPVPPTTVPPTTVPPPTIVPPTTVPPTTVPPTTVPPTTVPPTTVPTATAPSTSTTAAGGADEEPVATDLGRTDGATTGPLEVVSLGAVGAVPLAALAIARRRRHRGD